MREAARQRANGFHFLRLQKLILQFLSLGDVLHDRDKIVGDFSRLPHGRKRKGDPHLGAVLAQIALVPGGLANGARSQLLPRFQIAAKILRMGDRGIREMLHLLPTAAHNLAEMAVNLYKPPCNRVDLHDTHSRLLEHRFESLLARL